jgi:hypothetical protein
MTVPVDVVPEGCAGLADSGSYYPDDMPVEWRLTYFSNAFPALLLPASQWLAAVESISDWRDDVHRNFRFYLEAPETIDDPRLTSAVRALADRLVAVVADAPQTRGEIGPEPSSRALLSPSTGRPVGWASRCPRSLNGDLRAARAWLEQLAVRPRLIILDKPTSTQLQQWQELLLLVGWA